MQVAGEVGAVSEQQQPGNDDSTTSNSPDLASLQRIEQLTAGLAAAASGATKSGVAASCSQLRGETQSTPGAMPCALIVLTADVAAVCVPGHCSDSKSDVL